MYLFSVTHFTVVDHNRGILCHLCIKQIWRNNAKSYDFPIPGSAHLYLWRESVPEVRMYPQLLYMIYTFILKMRITVWLSSFSRNQSGPPQMPFVSEAFLVIPSSVHIDSGNTFKWARMISRSHVNKTLISE